MIWLTLLSCSSGPGAGIDTATPPAWEVLHTAEAENLAPSVYGPFDLDGGVWSVVDDELVRLDGEARIEHGRPPIHDAWAAGGDRVLVTSTLEDSDAFALLDLSTDPPSVRWEANDVGWSEVVGDHVYFWRAGEYRRFDLRTGEDHAVDHVLFSCDEGPRGACCHVDDFTYATLVDGVETVVPLTDDIFEPMLLDCIIHPSGEVSLARWDGATWWLERRDAAGSLLHRGDGPAHDFGWDDDRAPMTRAGETAWLSGWVGDERETWAIGPAGVDHLPGTSRRSLGGDAWWEIDRKHQLTFSDGTTAWGPGQPETVLLRDGRVYARFGSSVGGGIPASEYLGWLLTLGMRQPARSSSTIYRTLVRSTFTLP